jgi:ribokinase
MRAERGLVLAVLGAINVDLVVSGAPLPQAGETVTGGTFVQHHGGKGGNQAVAAARVMDQGTVEMIGAVGDDQLGAAALEALRAENVETDHVAVMSTAPTGVALIAVGPEGENQISVAPGANVTLDPAHVVEALERLEPHVLLASLEVPEQAVRAALEWSHDHGVPAVLNPAPPRRWARDLAELASYLTPNEHEREALGDIPAGVIVIETRGANGAVVDGEGARTHVPAPSVDVVDTTGAGDCFNGVFATGLVRELPLLEAVRHAVVAAALSVRTAGAREGMPYAAEISSALRG